MLCCVSEAIAQFAKAAGATVIATTSSDEKAERLRKLGADHVINYKTDASWGETAKSLSPGQRGVGHIIEVGGPATLTQVRSVMTRKHTIHSLESLC